IAAGAGSINVRAAAELLSSGVLSQTTIAGERTTDSGLVFVAKGHNTQVQQLFLSNSVGSGAGAVRGVSARGASTVQDGFMLRVGSIKWDSTTMGGMTVPAGSILWRVSSWQPGATVGD